MKLIIKTTKTLEIEIKPSTPRKKKSPTQKPAQSNSLKNTVIINQKQ